MEREGQAPSADGTVAGMQTGRTLLDLFAKLREMATTKNIEKVAFISAR